MSSNQGRNDVLRQQTLAQLRATGYGDSPLNGGVPVRNTPVSTESQCVRESIVLTSALGARPPMPNLPEQGSDRMGHPG